MISVLQALGFGSQGELLCPWQPVYSAAVYYFRNGTNMSATYYPIPIEEQQAALSALFSHGFPDKRDPRKEFFGFKVFAAHISETSFGSFIANSGIVGAYPLKVIHLIRRDYFLMALSKLEAENTNVWFTFSPGETQRGAVLNFTDQLLGALTFNSMKTCLSAYFYQSDLAEAEQAGLIQVLTVDSSDIDSSSPSIDSTLETVRQFLLRDVQVSENKGFQNRNSSIQQLLDSEFVHHFRGRSTLPLEERIPEPNTIYDKLRKQLTHMTQRREPEIVFQTCKKQILSEIDTLFSN